MKTFSVIAILLVFLSGCTWCDVTKAPGHLKKFGEGRQSPEPIAEMTGFPSAFRFFSNFLRKSRPLLMKEAAKLGTAFHEWTDEFLMHHPESAESYISIEEGKKENRSFPSFDATFRTFLKVYKHMDVYLVGRTPTFLRKDILVPCPIQCPDLLENHIHTLYMWFSSGGTKSVVHNDNLENINCLYRGDKQLVMIDSNKYTIPFDHPDEGFSSVDVESVDYEKYPWAAEIEYQHVNMTAGDCLYIPANWYHQVNSNGSNLAVNIWIEPEAMQTFDISTCSQVCDLSLTMDTAKLFTKDKGAILESIADDAAFAPKDLVDHLLKTSEVSTVAMAQREEYKYFVDWATKLLEKNDADKDGKISKTELEHLSPKMWHQLTHSLETIQLTEHFGQGDVMSEDDVTEAPPESKKEEL